MTLYTTLYDPVTLQHWHWHFTTLYNTVTLHYNTAIFDTVILGHYSTLMFRDTRTRYFTFYLHGCKVLVSEVMTAPRVKLFVSLTYTLHFYFLRIQIWLTAAVSHTEGEAKGHFSLSHSHTTTEMERLLKVTKTWIHFFHSSVLYFYSFFFYTLFSLSHTFSLFFTWSFLLSF